jgi:hypothetical protein
MEEGDCAMSVDQGTYDSVNSANYKTLGDSPSFYTQMGFANSVANQQANWALERSEREAAATVRQAAIAAAVKMLLTVTPEQAVSDSKTLTGDDLASKLANLLGALNGGSIGSKIMDQTPPVTPK